MFSFDHLGRAVTAMVGALVLSTLTVVAAAAPAESATAATTAYAQVVADHAHG
jgi:hypothetical protein